MAVEGAACGEVADEEALNAGHPDGEGMDVLAEAGQIAADVGSVSTNVRSEVLEVFVDFLPEAQEVGSEIFAQTLDTLAVPVRRARKLRRISYRRATMSATRIAPWVRVAMSLANRVGSELLVKVLPAQWIERYQAFCQCVAR